MISSALSETNNLVKRLEDKLKVLDNLMLFFAGKPVYFFYGEYKDEFSHLTPSGIERERVKVKEQLEDLKYERTRFNIRNEDNDFMLKNNRGDWDVKLDFNRQIIQIGPHLFGNFESLLKNLGIKNPTRKTQIKGGLSLIYSIANKKIDGNILTSDFLDGCIEFRQKWGNRNFNEKGIKKKKVTKTDYESAKQILSSCGSSIKLKLSEDQKNISIIK